jgi:hypothetical protein
MNRSRSRRRPANGSRGNSNSNNERAGRVEARPFWTNPPAEDDPIDIEPIRPVPDPGAMVRSLGPPPLFGGGGNAEHYFAAVYDRASMLAGALAAASGLLDLGAEADHGDDPPFS